MNSIAFSNDGKYIVSGSSDRTVLVWDANDGTLVSRPLTGHAGPIRCVTFSPDGRYILSACEGGRVRALDSPEWDSRLVLLN